MSKNIGKPMSAGTLTAADRMELQDEEALREELEALREENELLRNQIASLTNQAKPQATGRGGWVVTTKNPQYEGRTAGVMFRGGRAFIPDGDGAAGKANALKVDFGYQVEYVEDWQGLPEAPELQRSFIDVLTGR